MTNSAPTTFDTSRIVTPADIIDDGKIDKTADFGIDEHLALIADIEETGAVAADLSDTQLDNLAAYFTSLPSSPWPDSTLAILLWGLVWSSSDFNTCGLHTRSVEFVRENIIGPIVTPADIIDDGKIDKTADFGINEHLDLIEKIEAEGAVATDLSDTQLDNLAAYFTSLSYEPAMKLWSVVGASSENNAIGLHCLTGDFLVRILAEKPLTEAEKAEQAKQAEQAEQFWRSQPKPSRLDPFEPLLSFVAIFGFFPILSFILTVLFPHAIVP
jgi:hypothetical protein